MKRLLAALLLLISAAPAFGQTNPVKSAQFGLAITAATTLTVPQFSNYAVVCARGGNANFSTDLTTAPTGSTGQQLLQNACLSLNGSQTLSAFQAIQQTGNTTTLDVQYYR